MKATKIMIAVLGTFLITWCILGLIGYLLSDDSISYKECMRHEASVFLMIVLGWIPSLIVGNDLQNKLN